MDLYREQSFPLPLYRCDERSVWSRVGHKNGVLEGFTKKYKINQLVYREFFQDIESAIAREKQLKGCSRAKKIALIEKMNPGWEDLPPYDAG
jgi:predicted GIY-YIG superfamily endonuclease